MHIQSFAKSFTDFLKKWYLNSQLNDSKLLYINFPNKNNTLYLEIVIYLEGHGNEADFLGFLQKLVPHEHLTLHFEPFRFSLRIRWDIPNRKMIAYRYNFFQTYK